MTTPKISVYSLPDLKNTTDDIIPTYLTSLKFTQDHTKANVRLALGYSAVIIAGATFYFDWTLGWDATKYWTAWAVAAYFLLNGAFTYWILVVEKGVVFEGVRQDGGRLTLISSTKKNTPVYNLTARYSLPRKPQQELKLSAPFTRWFTSDGYFVAKPFQQWLASEIPVVGQADPNNVVEEIGRGSAASEGSGQGGISVEELARSGINLEQLMGGAASTGTPGAKKAKRRA